jgi:hypothetical protein
MEWSLYRIVRRVAARIAEIARRAAGADSGTGRADMIAYNSSTAQGRIA